MIFLIHINFVMVNENNYRGQRNARDNETAKLQLKIQKRLLFVIRYMFCVLSFNYFFNYDHLRRKTC